ncbi:hypothetical protein BGW42_000031 [Actinomortierella wolfii]|nr:hypothetical protein BGW42_000031 [Actinomortierella wolfii]
MSRAHWVVHRHQPYSTKATQSGVSMALVQSKTPYVPTVAATTAFSTSMPSAHWSRAWVTASVVSGSIFGPMVWSRVKPGYKVAYCAAPAASTTGIRSYPPSKEPLISTREITFGTVMGLGSGFLFKKLGKLILLVIGLGFVSLQLLANQGYVTVHWSRFERRFKDSFDLDGDGKVTVNDAKHGFRALIDLLTKNFQFKSTFIGGFVMGFRYG